MDRTDVKLKMSPKAIEDFKIWVEKKYPGLELDEKGIHHCKCGQCHGDMVREFIDWLGANN